ncbi:MAG: hypothetical protein Ct9H300mP13_7000 [Gammaproteobacteria bacterium]|nr:MAG: hypothetical protein Ct9H300mP13_7000 [Gammaproteobacteria bacterium]
MMSQAHSGASSTSSSMISPDSGTSRYRGPSVVIVVPSGTNTSPSSRANKKPCGVSESGKAIGAAIRPVNKHPIPTAGTMLISLDPRTITNLVARRNAAPKRCHVAGDRVRIETVPKNDDQPERITVAPSQVLTPTGSPKTTRLIKAPSTGEILMITRR